MKCDDCKTEFDAERHKICPLCGWVPKNKAGSAGFLVCCVCGSPHIERRVGRAIDKKEGNSIKLEYEVERGYCTDHVPDEIKYDSTVMEIVKRKGLDRPEVIQKLKEAGLVKVLNGDVDL